MTLWYKLGIAAFLLAVLSGLALLYGNAREETGRLEERTAQQSAHIEWRKQFDRDRAVGALRVSKAEANLHAERRKSDALKADIAQRDKDAADWLAVKMPIPLADLVWIIDSGPLTDSSGKFHVLNTKYDSE
mgnify:CR=1 FL=1